MNVERLARPLPVLALFAIAVLATAVTVVQAIEAGTHPELLADALTLDLVVTVPLAYWFLAVRGAGWPRLSVLPVFVLSVATTRLVPGLDAGRLLPWLEWVAIPAELFLLTIVARRAVAMSRAMRRSEGSDALESLRRAALELVEVERAAEIIAYEAAVLWYALAGGGSRGTHPFRALGRRSILLTDDELVVRLGLRWSLRVPLARIRAVRGTSVQPGAGHAPDPGHLRAVILGAERQVVELDSELVATGFYGLRRRVRSIGLSVDEPERFLAAIQRRLGPPAG